MIAKPGNKTAAPLCTFVDIHVHKVSAQSAILVPCQTVKVPATPMMQSIFTTTEVKVSYLKFLDFLPDEITSAVSLEGNDGPCNFLISLVF